MVPELSRAADRVDSWVIDMLPPRTLPDPDGGANERRISSPISVARCSSAVCRSSSKNRGAGDGAATWVSSWAMMPRISASGDASRCGSARWMTSPVVAATLFTAARARCDASPVETRGVRLPTIRSAIDANWIGSGLGRSWRCRLSSARNRSARSTAATRAAPLVGSGRPSVERCTGRGATARSAGSTSGCADFLARLVRGFLAGSPSPAVPTAAAAAAAADAEAAASMSGSTERCNERGATARSTRSLSGSAGGAVRASPIRCSGASC